MDNTRPIMDSQALIVEFGYPSKFNYLVKGPALQILIRLGFKSFAFIHDANS